MSCLERMAPTCRGPAASNLQTPFEKSSERRASTNTACGEQEATLHRHNLALAQNRLALVERIPRMRSVALCRYIFSPKPATSILRRERCFQLVCQQQISAGKLPLVHHDLESSNHPKHAAGQFLCSSTLKVATNAGGSAFPFVQKGQLLCHGEVCPILL